MKRVLLCAVLLAWSGMASAVVYKWTDAHGTVQYGDQPPDGVNAQIVRLLGTQHVNVPAPSTHTASALVDQALADEQKQQEQQAVQEDVAAARKKQCADAQTRYKQLIEGRHLFKLGPKGERIYLTSAEIDAARLSAKSNVDSLCNNNSSAS
ncbi:MAG TPA: DUF4124 domain-containing protein [Steroidobacteraceae bacterium]|nr:DUF4124 domain-containing protein [Steroidobacteraceae bacterium]